MGKPFSGQLGPHLIGREDDVKKILGIVSSAACCSVLGVSNVGKSTLMRALSLPAVVRDLPDSQLIDSLLVYVDFNLILQFTEQGFHEVVLRSLLATLKARDADPELVSRIQEAYQTVINPSSPMLMALSFEESMDALLAHVPGMVIFLLDEFDEVFAGLDAQIFVRMRALKERSWSRVAYVTATYRPLTIIRRERQIGEFCELFDGNNYFVKPLVLADARQLVEEWTRNAAVRFSPADVDWVIDCAGGHPSLLQATCRFLARAKEEDPWRSVDGDYERMGERLAGEAGVRLECAKLWTDLTSHEQEILLAWLGDPGVSADLQSLVEKGILCPSSEGKRAFASLFTGFVRRQGLVRRAEPLGVRVDVESGDVWVDGKLAPVLTELEYKLLLLLYGNLDKIIDKYHIVEAVWGENYIDEVDDARIEKLVSRLREKLEPDAQEARYLTTVRGRGYKLVSPA
jgi:hypothetical protein